jgi:protein SCO1/2
MSIRHLHRCALALLATSALAVRAQVAASDLLKQVGFDQNLNMQVPLDLHFQNEDGNDVELGDFFHTGRPVILVLGYYGCPMLCTQVLNGVAGSLKGVTLKSGSDFEVVVVSIDATEGSELAAAKKRSYVSAGDATPNGWHFLTGKQPEIDRVCRSAGFRYAKDGNQFAHPSGIVVLTPQGLISRYLLGIEFPPREVRLSLIEASRSQIGTLADQVLLLCYRYDPTTGKYGFAIIQSIRVAGILTVLALAAFITVSLRRERRAKVAQAH